MRALKKMLWKKLDVDVRDNIMATSTFYRAQSFQARVMRDYLTVTITPTITLSSAAP